MPYSRALSMPLLLLATAGCFAQSELPLRPPPDPAVIFPDAEVVLAMPDAAAPDALAPGEDARPSHPDAADGGVAPDVVEGMDVLAPDVGGPDATEPAPDGGVPTYWRDVYPIVVSRCAYCHAAEERDRLAGVPPIVTYAHTQAASVFQGQNVAERMAARVLNSQGSAGDMPQRGSPFANTMTMTERRIMAQWVNAGSPEGTMPDGGVAYPDASVPDSGGGTPLPWASGNPNPDAGTPGVRYVDVWANENSPGVPHNVPGRDTVYSCFVFTVPPHPDGATSEFAIEMSPQLDQRRHVHHIEIYRQDPNNPIDPIGNNGPLEWHLNTWWNCEGRASQEQLIANYVPGQPLPIRLPRGTGYQIRPGDRLMMELHYDSLPVGGLPDMTGIRITTTTTQASLVNVGEFWVGPLWSYDISPSTNNTPGRHVEISSECTISRNVNVFWMRPHMHARGVRQRFWIRRQGSATRTYLAGVDPWDAGNQPLFEVPQAEQIFRTGDVVGTSCEFVTEGRNMLWGTGGVDEMCFFNMIHYPYTFAQNACFTYCDRDRSRCPVNYP